MWLRERLQIGKSARVADRVGADCKHKRGAKANSRVVAMEQKTNSRTSGQ